MIVRLIDCKGSDSSYSTAFECDYYTTEKNRLKIFKEGICIYDLPMRFFGIQNLG